MGQETFLKKMEGPFKNDPNDRLRPLPGTPLGYGCMADPHLKASHRLEHLFGSLNYHVRRHKGIISSYHSPARVVTLHCLVGDL